MPKRKSHPRDFVNHSNSKHFHLGWSSWLQNTYPETTIIQDDSIIQVGRFPGVSIFSFLLSFGLGVVFAQGVWVDQSGCLSFSYYWKDDDRGVSSVFFATMDFLWSPTVGSKVKRKGITPFSLPSMNYLHDLWGEHLRIFMHPDSIRVITIPYVL